MAVTHDQVVATFVVSSFSRMMPPVLRRSLWQVAQYLSSRARWAAAVVAVERFALEGACCWGAADKGGRQITATPMNTAETPNRAPVILIRRLSRGNRAHLEWSLRVSEARQPTGFYLN